MDTLMDILQGAVKRKASDIHLTVGRPAMYRVDGELQASGSQILSGEDTAALLKPLMGKRQLEELSLEGEVDFAYEIEGMGRFRVNIFKQKGSMAGALRLLPLEIPKPETLGIPKELTCLTEKRRGLILVTGATGSGKSTTLAALIGVINRTRKEHVITLEDPIEYVHRHDKSIVNQRELGEDTRSYSHALRAALRQDPDVILVGEMRDLETISTAITAAETGHLVFSTLHTMGAANTIDRIIDVFPPGQQQQIRVQLALVLEGVISQQLLPTASGRGRVAAMEILIANMAIRNLIREGKTFQIPSVLQTSRKAGMQTMDDAIYDLYMRGKITAAAAVSYAQDAAAMSQRVMLD